MRGGEQGALRRAARKHGVHNRLCSVAYLSRLAVALLWVLLCTFINAFFSVCAGYRYPAVALLDAEGKPTGQRTLPDIGHDIVAAVIDVAVGTPEMREAYIDWYEGPDFFMWTASIVVFILLLLHPRRLLVIRRSCIVVGWLMIMRSFCIIVTSLPDASPKCAVHPAGLRRGFTVQKALLRTWKVWIHPDTYHTCGDSVFSGHTTYAMLVANVFATYCHGAELRFIGERVCRWVRGCVWVMTAACVVCVVGTRLHYTLDASLAVYLTSCTWHAHHRWARDPQAGRWAVMDWLPDSVSEQAGRYMAWMERDIEMRSIDDEHNAESPSPRPDIHGHAVAVARGGPEVGCGTRRRPEVECGTRGRRRRGHDLEGVVDVERARQLAEALVSVLGSAHFPCTKVEDGEGAHAHGPGKIKAKVV